MADKTARKQQTRYPEVYAIEMVREPDGKAKETLYFVSTKKGKISVFAHYFDKNPNDFDEVKINLSVWEWKNVPYASFARLSDEKVKELMEERGLAAKLQQS